MGRAVKVEDALGREFIFDLAPCRIVSLVPSITETLFCFGLDREVVGATDYCVHPKEGLARVPRVGGTKGLHVDEVVALRPDLVIANREENRKEHVEALEARGLRVFVTYARTLSEAVHELGTLGRITGRQAAAAAIAREVNAALGEVAAGPKPRVLALIWKKPWMTLNRDTFAHDLICASGGQNTFADADARYPRISEAEMEAVDPELILLPSEPYAFGEHDRRELASLDCTAVRDGRVYLVEGELLSWYGPRMPRALRTFSRLFRS